MYCLGVTEHHTGTEGVMSLSNMAMMVGKIGKPGCGVNPIRGQNNVQGACDMGASPNQFSGYQNIDCLLYTSKRIKMGIEGKKRPVCMRKIYA